MGKKGLLLIVLLCVFSVSLFAENLLEYFEFDFDKYVDLYHQLIINDVSFDDNEETPYFDTLDTVLKLFAPELDEKALIDEIKKQDSEELKAYLASLTAKGVQKSDKEIEALLFNKDNMYSAFISPTTDSAMSFFGHNFLMFYIPEAPLLSPCINFFAYYDHLSAMGTVFAGLKGSLISYYDFQPFFVTFLDYTANRDRSIIMYKINSEGFDKDLVYKTMAGLKTNSYPNYNFLFYNCSHGFNDIMETIDPSLQFKQDRALSPAMGLRSFDENHLLSEAQFEFPAWNDVVNNKSPKEYKAYYRSIRNGEVGFKAEEPFKNNKFTRNVQKRKAFVSSRFSSAALNYGLNDELQHRLSLSFKPVFNDFFEQNYVDHELINLRVLSGDISMTIDKDSKVDFEGFKMEVLSFDSLFPFTTLLKRPSFGAHLDLGMKNYKFLAEGEFYLGITFGRSEIFNFTGLNNKASTVPLSYTLTLRNIFGASYKNLSLINVTDMVCFSTLYDYFHLENNLILRYRMIDALTLEGSYKIANEDGIKTRPRHSGTISLIYNFNIF